jgi:hypothetical protein
MDAKHCVGCRDDFYNGKNPHGVKACWFLPRAKLETRFRLHINTPVNQREGYVEMQLPQCYHERGYVYYEQIPAFATDSAGAADSGG